MSNSFKVAIVGAGPAGLYAAIRLRQLRGDIDIEVLEQGDADATWGFGVVFSDRALEFLREDDAETVDLITPRMETWSRISINHQGERIDIDGIGFSAIGRLELLKLLQQRAATLGITPRYGHRVESLVDYDDHDLVIGADGLNSVVRACNPAAFGETLEYLDNRFVWYGTNRPFDALTQTFKSTEWGAFNAHHYRYHPGHSTFLVECEAAAFRAAGFADMPEPEYRAVCESVFADELEGAGLIDNHSHWRRFPVLKNSRWFDDNRVLVGDALHTAHFSIGSGTRLALEDVVALTRALDDCAFDVQAALPLYQSRRQPVLDKLVSAAESSAAWYENFPTHMQLQPWSFALSYIMRSGRMKTDTLRSMSPGFFRGLESRGLLT